MLKAQGLTKNFKSFKKMPGVKGALQAFFKREYLQKSAVKSFDLSIEKGEIVALLGPNGAGKTTLMKMFTGIIVPSEGTLSINNFCPSDRHKDFRKKIALVMGQKSQLWWDIPAMDSFLLLQKYYEISDEDFNAKILEMGNLLQVTDFLHIHVRKLSLGERMKMELMASLLHSPEIIFLDEPTIGLDLIAQENIRKFIKNYHQKFNTTIILTSHYMADVHALCERLVLILNGKKAFDDSLLKFEKLLDKDQNVSFTFEGPQKNDRGPWAHYTHQWNHDRTHLELSIHQKELRDISVEILKQYPVTDFATEKLPIEKVMKALLKDPEILNNAKK